jgi:hypothetical protein
MFSLSSFCSFIGFFIAAVASALKSLPAASSIQQSRAKLF